MSDGLNIFLAFSAGLLSFFSPCLLPLLPVYLTYITGLSLKEENSAQARVKTAVHSLLFILGFTVIFVLLGATASYLGGLLYDFQDIILKAGGAVIIFLGIYLLGFFRIPFLDIERHPKFLKFKPAGYLGSVFVGMVLAIGWTPCASPILGAILLYAASSGSVNLGMLYLFVYALGFGIPLFILALTLNYFITLIDKLKPYLKYISQAAGVFLILMGIRLLFL